MISGLDGYRAGEIETTAVAFVHQLARLDVDDLEAVGRRWRHTVTTNPSGWFAAESAVGRAVHATGRRMAQESLLEALSDVAKRRGWWRIDRIQTTDGRGLTEAAVQYAATLAVIALLVRDVLSPGHFELVYGPFTPILPAELGGRSE